MKPRIAYVVAAWGGPRRGQGEPYNWLRRHFQEFDARPHELISEIIVAVPNDPQETPGFSRTVQELADRGVRVIRRPNIGLSYGSFTDAYRLLRETLDVDYWVFVEDDWYMIPDHWDRLLVEMYEELDAGYLCGLVLPSGRHRIIHAAISNGITSSHVLKSVWHYHGQTLPHAVPSIRLPYHEQGGQIRWSYAWIEAGYELRDVTEFGYRAPFWNVNRIEVFDPEKGDNDFMRPFQVGHVPMEHAKIRRQGGLLIT